MAIIDIDQTSLTVKIEGLDKLWAFTSSLTIPLEHITGATVGADESLWKGWKAPGVNIPGLVTAGSFHHDGRTVFWNVHHAAEAVEIDLNHEHYDRLIIGVDDPTATAAAINSAVRAG